MLLDLLFLKHRASGYDLFILQIYYIYKYIYINTVCLKLLVKLHYN